MEGSCRTGSAARGSGLRGLSPFVLVAFFFFGRRIIAGPSNCVLGLLSGLVRAIAGA